MLRVGLTGGYATGKTFVAAELVKLNCYVIYADQLGHQVLEPGGEAYVPAIRLFGTSIQSADGKIDRKKLGGIVFSNPEKLAALSAIVHPAVYRMEEQQLQLFEERHPQGIGVVEAAILVETGRYRFYDKLLLTTCDPEIQVSRAMARDHASREEALARIARQLPVEEKLKLASYVIDTGGSEEETVGQVRQVHEQLQALARH